jgi:23S rRNA (uracil1939-C5)-methyltransferase
LTQDKGRIAFAEGVTLTDASADRVYPRCAYFGAHKCGRCQWQHIDYKAQLLLKQDVLADQLARIGGFDDADVRATIPAAAQWGYNYHMTLLPTADGGFGFPGADEGAVIVADECHILHPDLFDLYERIDLETGGLTRLKLQLGSDGEHMLIFSVEDEEDAPELSADLKTSVNLLLPDNEPVNLIGESHSRYVIGGRTFRVTAGSDFRAHVGQLETLASLVTDALGLTGGESVLDFYGGVGFFTAFIAPLAGLVTLVESFPPAATDAEENLSELDNVDIIEGTAEDVLPELGEDYSAAILDPPSEGLSVEMMDALGDSKIPQLIYVSGDPATLARDAKRLAKHGYTLGAVQPIDLNPQTYYIDAAATFTL